MASHPCSLVGKIWARHVVTEREDGQSLLFVDRHLVHEGSRRGFELIGQRSLPVRRPDLTFALPDHYVPTAAVTAKPAAANMLALLRENARKSGVTLFDVGTRHHGIVHVVGPEAGLTLPGSIIVCGDSHTATHGAMGALAFGIGASEVSHVLATQTLWQARPRDMRIRVTGRLPEGVSAKDLALAVIARIGAAGGTGHAIEFTGEAVRALSMEGRLTLCNMAIEAGARIGTIAPDATTLAYLKGRPYAPQGPAWDAAAAEWLSLASDEDADFDQEVELDASRLAPMMTWGTSPEDAAPITGRVPGPQDYRDPVRAEAAARSIAYMGLEPGQPMAEIRFDRVFIGSCTNGRIEDLRAAAAAVRGRKAIIPAMVSPGSEAVSQQAEAEGIAAILREAGFEWRTPGCSMCVGLNGDLVDPGARCASTSNRNFAGRQGPGARTHLVAPALAARIALHGRALGVH
jgi:3-isopropylmalate/(R)-2-methylmalate dehydratase large subunit